MNNPNLCNYPLVKLSLSAVLLSALVTDLRADSVYGPVKAGETLSSIVNENYLVSTFEDRVIIREIFRTNPQAFIYNNIGLVKQGAMLTLPSDETIRRSRPQNNNISTQTQSTPASVSTSASLTASLEATLVQVRNERDQANLKMKRIEIESAARAKSLNSKISLLETDNQSIGQQLSQAETEIEGLKQSLLKVETDNAQLKTIADNQSPSTGDLDSKIKEQLAQSNEEIASKQQKITELEATVSDLRASAEEVRISHAAAIDDLNKSYAALEDKLALQVKDQATQVEGQLGQSDAEITLLKEQHQKAIDDLNTSFVGTLSEKNTVQADLKAEVESLKNSLTANKSDIEKLSVDNKELTLALSQMDATVESLTEENAVLFEKSTAKASTDSQQNTSVPPVAVDKLLSGPITKEVLVRHLENPVAFPLWGLLLGAFALGFTSLMMLFSRSRRQVVRVVANAVAPINDVPKEVEQEKPVFRASDHTAFQDPDVETLRVPPRRDPSRVPILDPSMVETLASTNIEPVSVPPEPEMLLETPLDSEQQFEANLKLLIADTYEELGDVSAANEMLEEVQKEGSPDQIKNAEEILARLKRA